MSASARTLRIAAYSALFLFFAGCISGYGPYKVSRSLYLGKKMLRFVMDNGAPYRSVKLAGGDTLHYWRSDRGVFTGFSIEDLSGDYCELALRSDRKKMITAIYVVEPSHICNTVLK